MDDFTQMLKKGGGGGGDLEFALIDRRPRSCAGAPVKMYCTVNYVHHNFKAQMLD